MRHTEKENANFFSTQYSGFQDLTVNAIMMKIIAKHCSSLCQ